MIPGFASCIGGLGSSAPIQIVGSTTSRGGGSWSSASSLTLSHTVDSGTSLLLVFGYSRASATSRSFSGITWNGAAMTEIYDHQDAGERSMVGAYYLQNPTPGTHNIVMTLSGNTTSPNFIAINLSGTHTTDPIGGFSVDDLGVTDEHTASLTAESATSVAFHQACWANTDAPPPSGLFNFDTAGFSELLDEADTGADGCRTGLAWKQLTASGALTSHVTCSDTAMVNSWGTLEIKRA